MAPGTDGDGSQEEGPARRDHDDFAFNDTTDISVVAWLAQYDPMELPPDLGNAFRLGPIQSSLGITQPIVWLANLSTDFRRAYDTIDDPHDTLGPSYGGRLNRETGKRTFPREFGRDEQARFDKLQDEYHNLRWRNLLNLGYDPATAATMVGAVRDAKQNLFSPPPLFALSPRMIVTDEGKRMSMKHVLVDYLRGRAEEAERALLDDLEKEDSGTNAAAGDGEGKKMSKNAKKKARKKANKAKKQAQQQEEQAAKLKQRPATESGQKPLSKEQLKYLREHKDQLQQEGQGQRKAYSMEDRRIIEDALERNGLSASAAIDPATAEKMYKEKESSSNKENGGGKSGDKDGKEREKSEGEEGDAKPEYEKEVQNYAYAWCCDYCKTATFPTFAEAALHESKCPVFLEMEKNGQVDQSGEGEGEAADDADQLGENDVAAEEKIEGKNDGKGTDSTTNGLVEEGTSQPESKTNNEPLVMDPKDTVDAINVEWDDKGESASEEAKQTPSSIKVADTTRQPSQGGDSTESSDVEEKDNGEQEVNASNASSHQKASMEEATGSASAEPPSSTLSAVVQPPQQPSDQNNGGNIDLGSDEWKQAQSKKKTATKRSKNKKGDKAATTTDGGASKEKAESTSTTRTNEKPSVSKKQSSSTESEKAASSATSSSDEKVATETKTAKSKQKKGSKKKNRAEAKQTVDLVDDAPKESSSKGTDHGNGSAPDVAPLSDREVAQITKPVTIDYDDRVNDTALPQPNDAGQSSSLPPAAPISPPAAPISPPVIPPEAPSVTAEQQASLNNNNARLSSLTSDNEILNARNNFLEQENKFLRATNEALLNELAAVKQKSVEAVQQVQLKAYIAESARDAAEERAAWLESLLANAVAETTAKEVVDREVDEAVTRIAAAHISRQQQNHISRPMPQASAPLPLPQALPQGFQLQMQQQQLLSPSMMSLPLPNMTAAPAGMSNNLLHHPAPQSAQIYNQSSHIGALQQPMPAPQDSLSNDFWEPPWMKSPVGAERESVLSRLRRGDHA